MQIARALGAASFFGLLALAGCGDDSLSERRIIGEWESVEVFTAEGGLESSTLRLFVGTVDVIGGLTGDGSLGSVSLSIYGGSFDNLSGSYRMTLQAASGGSLTMGGVINDAGTEMPGSIGGSVQGVGGLEFIIADPATLLRTR